MEDQNPASSSEWRGIASSWFANIQAESPPDTATALVLGLVQMLNHLRPTHMNRETSSIRENHAWHDVQGVEIVISHDSDEDAAITIAIDHSQAILSWISAHEHFEPRDGTEERPWTTTIVDATAAILRGEYEIEEVYRGRRLVKVRVVDSVESRRVLHTTGTIGVLLPWPRQKIVVRSLDFGVSR